MRIRNVATVFFFAFLLFSLNACSGYYKKHDTYVSKNGNVRILENDKESCIDSCNLSFERCSETGAAQNFVVSRSLTGVIGAKAECKSSLRSCLKKCKIR